MSADAIEALTDNQVTVANTSTGAATLEIAADAGTNNEVADLTKVDAVIDVTATIVNADFTLADNAELILSDAQTDLNLTGDTAATTLSITIADDDANGASTIADLATTVYTDVTVTNAEFDDADGTNDADQAEVAISAFGAADVTFDGGVGGLLVATSVATTGDITLLGSGDVDMSAGAITAASVDAAALTGDLNIQLDGVATVDEVTAGSGDDIVTIAGALTSGAFTIATGAGNDNVTIIDADAAIDMGDGTVDTITVAATADLSDNTTFSMTGVEVVDITTAGAAVLTLSATQFATDNSFVLLGNTTDDTLAVTGTAAADTIDASNVTVEIADANLVLSGAAGIDTITGSAVADTIAGGDAADVLVGGAGADNFTYDNIDDLVAGESISGGTGTDVMTFAAGAATVIDLTIAEITSVEALTFTTAADVVVVEQGTGLEDVTGFADATASTFTLVDGATAYEAAAEATAAAVDVAGEWFFAQEVLGTSNSALTYYDEVAGEAVTIELLGTKVDVAAGAADDSAALVAGNLVVTVA